MQDKIEEGQPARLILGYRRITANESLPDIRRNPDEMNDHQVATATDRIRLIAIETMKGAFGNEGALRFLMTEGRLLPSWGYIYSKEL